METIKQIKADIKELSAQQRVLKQYRKETYTGPRTMTPRQAFFAHQDARHDLRLMHAARALMKGLTLDDVEQKTKATTTPIQCFRKQIDAIIERYAAPICADQ